MFVIRTDLLDIFVEPLIGLADDDVQVYKYMMINPKTQEEYKKIIRENLKEFFEQNEDKKKTLAKLALRYYLSNSTIDFERVFYSNLIPFEAPIPAINFFLWIWQELFGNEAYDLNEQEYKMIIPK